MSESRFGRVITFYSYKGGVGRTLALADVGVFLAKMGKRVLMVDWDLEAPGLLMYFREWLPSTNCPDLLELIEKFGELEPNQAADHYSILDVPDTDGRLALLPAIARDADNHAQRVQALNWKSQYESGFGDWLEELRAAWQHDWDYILVDSRTGYSDIGGICTMHLPEVLIVFFTPNDQSIEGAFNAARHAQRGQQQLAIDRARLRVVPVVTRLDNTEHRMRRKWEKRCVERFSPLVDGWTDAPDYTPELFELLGVPYVPFWSYGEQLPAVTGDTSDKLGVERAHESLALLLSLQLTDIGRLVEDRTRVIEQSYGRWRYDIYLSASPDDRAVSNRLARALTSRGFRVVQSLATEQVEPGTVLSQVRDIVFLLGSESDPTQRLDMEVAASQILQRPTSRRIVPVVLQPSDAEILPDLLRDWQAVIAIKDSTGEIDIDRLADTLEVLGS